MIYYEFRKCLLNKKSIFLLLAAVILKLIFSFSSVKNNDVTVISDEKYFMEQIDFLSGKYSKENQNYIMQLYDKTAEANSEAALLPQKLRQGILSKEEYEEQSLSLNELLRHKSTVEEIYRRYMYVSENPDTRTFGYFDGWERLFEDKTPDILLIIVLIWLALTAFQAENEDGTVELLLTCKNGRARLAFTKLGCCMIVSSICVLLFSICQFVAVFSEYPIGDVFCNVQSIEAYADYSRQSSILSIYVMTLCIRILGGVTISVITCLLSQFSHKAVVVITASVMIVILPIFLFAENTLYRLPLPVALLCGNGPSMPEKKGIVSVLFQQMSCRETTVMILIGSAVLIIMALITVVLYCKKTFRR